MTTSSRGRWLLGQRIEGYEILHEVSSSATGSSFVARETSTGQGQRVAIKALHPHLAAKTKFAHVFLDETRRAAQIHHPNVVGIHDIRREGNLLYVVVDFVDGGTVAELLTHTVGRGKRLPAPITLAIVRDVLTGLHAAHDLVDRDGHHLNLVHRDVSPRTIVVGTDGISRLADFGVAKAEQRRPADVPEQTADAVAYMAPEQAENGSTDVRSDVFSVGVVMWEMLTGQRLFDAESAPATLKALLFEPIPALSAIEPDLAALDPVVSRALTRAREDRFPTADAMRGAIEGVFSEAPWACARDVGRYVQQVLQQPLFRLETALQRGCNTLDRGSDRPDPEPLEIAESDS